MEKFKINVVILCDSVIFCFFKNCILFRESYAFPKVIAEDHMDYDITAAILQNGGKSVFYRFY